MTVLDFLRCGVLAVLVSSLLACGGGDGDGGGGGGGGGGGVETAPVTPPTPAALTVTTQPQAAGVAAGQPASFTVVAAGTAPLSYQWLRGGSAIVGATAATYTLLTSTLADDGARFTVRVSDATSTVISDPALLSVSAIAAPQIARQPADQSATAGQTVTFSIDASAPAGTALSYQWRRDGTDIAAATQASYTTPVLAAADSGARFAVLVSAGPATSVLSNEAVLTVLASAGTASACFDANLGDTPGASYELALRSTPSGGGAIDEYVETGNISGPVTFNGREAYEYKQTTTSAGPPVTTTVYKYYGKRTGPAERTEYGATFSLNADPMTTNLLENPPVVDGTYALMPGQSISLSYSHTPRLTVTFAGIERVTVPAGTYSACRFTLDSTTPAYANQRWILVGTGVVIKEVQSQPGLGSVTIEARSITVNGNVR